MKTFKSSLTPAEYKKAYDGMFVIMNAMADDLLDESKKGFKENGGLYQTLLGFGITGECTLEMPFEFRSPEDRAFKILKAKVRLLLSRSSLYTISGEAWKLTITGPDAIERIEQHRWGDLAKNPNKVEVINVVVGSIFGAVGRSSEIIRGDTITFKDEEPKLTAMEGDLAELLPHVEKP